MERKPTKCHSAGTTGRTRTNWSTPGKADSSASRSKKNTATERRGMPQIKKGQNSAERSKPPTETAVVPRNQFQAPIPMERKGALLAPKGYTMKPIIPAKKAELVSVARAMHREDMGSRVKKLFQPEVDAATEAIQTGIYIGWRCPEFKWDCIRVSSVSKCFCGHLLDEHAPYNGKSTRVPCHHCSCQGFEFIPGRPEDIGEFWHQKRRDFDPSAWRAQCRCKHTHEQHGCDGLRRCKFRGCSCSSFTSNFLCAACDRHWEDHVTVFETENDRRRNEIPYGEDYLPFAEMPNLRNMALTGIDDEPGDSYRALTNGLGPIPHNKAVTQNTPFRPSTTSGFKPVYD